MFNKSEIMKRAWEIVRKADVRRYGLRLILRNALRTAWHEAKQRVADEARLHAPKVALTAAQVELERLHNKTRWTPVDYCRAKSLQRAA